MASVLTPEALTTLDNLKERLGITGTSRDNELERLINRATSRIEERTERKLKARRYDNGGSTHPTTNIPDEDYIYFSGTTLDKGGDTLVEQGCGIFYLPAWPIRADEEEGSAAFKLEALSNRVGDDWAELIENQDYILDRPNGVLTLLNGRFTSGLRNYRITCAAGYLLADAPHVPGDLEDLCILIAKGFTREAGITSEKLGTWSRSYDPQAARTEIDEGIARYRRWSL